MAFDIKAIAGEIASTGLLRTNKFELNFSPPPGLKTGSLSSGGSAPTQNYGSLQNIDRNIALYGEMANIPGIAMEVAPVRRFGYGPNEKKPFSPTFADATFIFRSDASGLVWKYLQSWFRLVLNYQNDHGLNAQSGILSNQHPFELGYKTDYVTDISVDVFNDKGDIAIRTVLREAYPIFIGDIALDWKDKNNYVRIPATFTFIDWYHSDAKPISAGTQSYADTLAAGKAPV